MNLALKKIVPSSRNYAVTTVENILIVLHRSGPAAPLVAEMPEHFEKIFRTQSQVGLLLVVKDGCKPPEGPARDKTNELLRLYSQQLRSAVVMEGSGFWAAAIRSALTLISMSASHPMKIFTTPEEGTNWLCREMGRQNASKVTPSQILDVLDRLG
jgi:hypothetical protein